jgi:hypothetical protein
MLDSIIYEPNVKVEDFHEKEVMELILILYDAFYTDTLTDLDWEYTDEDWKWLKENMGEDSAEYQ